MRSTASSSEGRISPMRTILRDNCRKYWTLPALGMLWFLVWGFIPLIMRGVASDQGSLTDYAMNENIGYVISILTLGVGAGVTMFAYLQDRGAANYVHSLPLSRRRLFVANFLSGLVLIEGPLVANAILMSALARSPLFLKWLLVTSVCCFAIYAITVFAAMISGNVLMHLFNAAFFNGLLTLLVLVFFTVCDALLKGYSGSDWLTILWGSNALTAGIGNFIMRRWLLCLIYGGVGVVFTALAWLLYERRPVEKTGDSVMFAWVRTLLFLICVFCGTCLTGLVFAEILGNPSEYGVDHVMVIGMIAGALLTFVIGSLLIDRSARIFTRQNLVPAGIAVILAFTVLVGVDQDVLGYGSKVPAQSDVQVVYMDWPELMGDYYEDAYRFQAGFYESEQAHVMTIDGKGQQGLTSPEAIGAVLRLHQLLIDQEATDDWASNISLHYVLKNGRQMHRTFPVYVKGEQAHETYDEGYAISIKDNPVVIGAIEQIYRTEEFKAAFSVKALKPEYFTKSTLRYYPNEGPEDVIYGIPQKLAPSLQDALEQDFLECSLQDMMNSENPTIDAMNNQTDETLFFPVPPSAKHTRAWLKKHKEDLK